MVHAFLLPLLLLLVAETAGMEPSPPVKFPANLAEAFAMGRSNHAGAQNPLAGDHAGAPGAEQPSAKRLFDGRSEFKNDYERKHEDAHQRPRRIQYPPPGPRDTYHPDQRDRSSSTSPGASHGMSRDAAAPRQGGYDDGNSHSYGTSWNNHYQAPTKSSSYDSPLRRAGERQLQQYSYQDGDHDSGSYHSEEPYGDRYSGGSHHSGGSSDYDGGRHGYGGGNEHSDGGYGGGRNDYGGGGDYYGGDENEYDSGRHGYGGGGRNDYGGTDEYGRGGGHYGGGGNEHGGGGHGYYGGGSYGGSERDSGHATDPEDEYAVYSPKMSSKFRSRHDGNPGHGGHGERFGSAFGPPFKRSDIRPVTFSGERKGDLADSTIKHEGATPKDDFTGFMGDQHHQKLMQKIKEKTARAFGGVEKRTKVREASPEGTRFFGGPGNMFDESKEAGRRIRDQLPRHAPTFGSGRRPVAIYQERDNANNRVKEDMFQNPHGFSEFMDPGQKFDHNDDGGEPDRSRHPEDLHGFEHFDVPIVVFEGDGTKRIEEEESPPGSFTFDDFVEPTISFGGDPHLKDEPSHNPEPFSDFGEPENMFDGNGNDVFSSVGQDRHGSVHQGHTNNDLHLHHDGETHRTGSGDDHSMAMPYPSRYQEGAAVARDGSDAGALLAEASSALRNRTKRDTASVPGHGKASDPVKTKFSEARFQNVRPVIHRYYDGVPHEVHRHMGDEVHKTPEGRIELTESGLADVRPGGNERDVFGGRPPLQFERNVFARHIPRHVDGVTFGSRPPLREQVVAPQALSNFSTTWEDLAQAGSSRQAIYQPHYSNYKGRQGHRNYMSESDPYERYLPKYDENDPYFRYASRENIQHSHAEDGPAEREDLRLERHRQNDFYGGRAGGKDRYRRRDRPGARDEYGDSSISDYVEERPHYSPRLRTAGAHGRGYDASYPDYDAEEYETRPRYGEERNSDYVDKDDSHRSDDEYDYDGDGYHDNGRRGGGRYDDERKYDDKRPYKKKYQRYHDPAYQSGRYKEGGDEDDYYGAHGEDRIRDIDGEIRHEASRGYDDSRRTVNSMLDAIDEKRSDSNCKEVAKDGMTCFQCTDAKGFQTEDCAYASKDPNNHHVSYSESSSYGDDKRRGYEKRGKLRRRPGGRRLRDGGAAYTDDDEAEFYPDGGVIYDDDGRDIRGGYGFANGQTGRFPEAEEGERSRLEQLETPGAFQVGRFRDSYTGGFRARRKRHLDHGPRHYVVDSRTNEVSPDPVYRYPVLNRSYTSQALARFIGDDDGFVDVDAEARRARKYRRYRARRPDARRRRGYRESGVVPEYHRHVESSQSSGGGYDEYATGSPGGYSGSFAPGRGEEDDDIGYRLADDGDAIGEVFDYRFGEKPIDGRFVERLESEREDRPAPAEYDGDYGDSDGEEDYGDQGVRRYPEYDYEDEERYFADADEPSARDERGRRDEPAENERSFGRVEKANALLEQGYRSAMDAPQSRDAEPPAASGDYVRGFRPFSDEERDSGRKADSSDDSATFTGDERQERRVADNAGDGGSGGVSDDVRRRHGSHDADENAGDGDGDAAYTSGERPERSNADGDRDREHASDMQPLENDEPAAYEQHRYDRPDITRAYEVSVRQRAAMVPEAAMTRGGMHSDDELTHFGAPETFERLNRGAEMTREYRDPGLEFFSQHPAGFEHFPTFDYVEGSDRKK
ncbi:hornerin-like [Pollicipes pollicipes]|uniref:hornerin-like n=1 Tax=Pollicipes pollicipes TaxID=41117 RepID=UPI0018852AF9|nr:hornerin-like [Pollicipes pollicipes]